MSLQGSNIRKVFLTERTQCTNIVNSFLHETSKQLSPFRSTNVGSKYYCSSSRKELPNTYCLKILAHRKGERKRNRSI
uniref:Uncharacterized protein n=1 Tax=Populus trichocarpa TaxID=3694 RepID=A0A2K1Y091_POPTR